MIDFELSEGMQNMRTMTHMLAEQAMRPISREYDEREHEKPWDFLNMMWNVSRGATMTSDGSERKERKGPLEQNLAMCVTVEELCWGDVGLYLSIPNSGLGGAAVAAAGTPEQKERFLARFREGEPKWGAMASVRPSDAARFASLSLPSVLLPVIDVDFDTLHIVLMKSHGFSCSCSSQCREIGRIICSATMWVILRALRVESDSSKSIMVVSPRLR